MPTGKKHATVGWDDGGKIGKINSNWNLPVGAWNMILKSVNLLAIVKDVFTF